MNPTDGDLGARFAELRQAEAADAPGLTAVLHHARRRPRPVPRRAAALLLVGAAASIAALALVRFRLQATETRPPVAAWRSPTTSLIPANRTSVLAPPPLLSSVLDGATASSLWPKGD